MLYDKITTPEVSQSKIITQSVNIHFRILDIQKPILICICVFNLP